MNPSDPTTSGSPVGCPRDIAEGTGSSDRVPPKILVGICSCLKYPEKREAVRKTWMAHAREGIECSFFVGGGQAIDGEIDTIAVAADDSYGFLPAKVIAFFRHALEHFEFDWLFKCDDDTYVALDRLRTLLDFDVELVGNETLAARGSPSGGAGYLLSRRMVELIAGDQSLPAWGAEDIIIGEAAIRHGAKSESTALLRWNATPSPRIDNDLITAHWCSPERMHAIHSAMINPPHRRIRGFSPSWTDDLWFYEDGHFLRENTGCNGYWEQTAADRIALRWFDWEEEVLKLDDDTHGRVAKPVRKTTLPEAAELWTAVWLTSGNKGVPHLGRFLEKNPSVPVHVVNGRPFDDPAERTNAWRNCDRLIRDWWRNTGNQLHFDKVLFLEWDVLFNEGIEEVMPDGEFVVCDAKVPGKSDWIWFAETNSLPPEMRKNARGAAPLAIMALSRACLETMMSHPLAEELFEADIFCELRFPSLARHCGFEPIDNRAGFPDVQFHEVTPGSGNGVWHAVKA